ncbi:MAG TPA: cupin domain-containing protein [Thermoanaerobaculia bacterium]|nr:cupin domain-containing protein [Thermoanaerobaculia bacterium]
MEKINLAEKLSRIHDHWSPKIVADLNENHVKLVKLKGEFVWHKHEAEDEMFLVVSGRIRILFRGHDVDLAENEMLVVPRGVEHMPVAEEEAHVLLVEPKTTVNTGDAGGPRTVPAPERI